MKKFLLSLSLAASTVGALPAADYVPIFREDWVWKYTDELYDNSVDTERTCREYEMCFDGVTVINDITWHNFKKTKSVEFKYKWNHDTHQYVLISSKDIECGETFLIREDDGKYFMRLPEGNNLGYNYESWWNIDGPEGPLYDFNCHEGESFMTIGESGEAETLEVSTVSSIQIDGKELKVLNTVYGRPIVEGIGYVKSGILPYGQFSFPVGSSAHGPELVSIEDLNGNIVFTPDMLKPTTYVPMIREDRVWEYYGRYEHAGEEGLAYHCMKFDGTQEVQGKEYHRFVLFKSTYVNWDVDLNKHYRVEMRNEPVYLLREEEGKVYALYQNEELVANYNPDNADATGNLSEFKLYDFTLSDGDIVDYPLHTANLYYTRPYKVKIQSSVNIAGEECKVMRMGYPDHPEFEIPIDFIEGVGINYNGCLASFGLEFITGAGNSYYSPGAYATINRVLDLDGNVVYGDGSAPPAPKDFNEDWVWKYSEETYDNLAYIEGKKTCYDFEMRFDGVTKINGVTWHNFKKTKSVEIKYQWDFDAEKYDVVSSRDIECGETFLIREEDGKYFLRLPEDSNMGFNYESWWHMENPEALLYDFNCDEGEAFMTVGNTGEADTYEVKSVSCIQIDGKDFKVFNSPSETGGYGAPVIEGIGYVTHGILPYGHFTVPVGSPGAGPDIVSIVDLEGNIVFTPDMLNTRSVDGVLDDVKLTMSWKDNEVVAVADGDATVTLEVIGIDGAKRATASGRGQAAADLTQLAPGVYVVRASDGSNVKTAKIMINYE